MRRLNQIVPLIRGTNIPRLVILFAFVLTVSSVAAQHFSGSGAVPSPRQTAGDKFYVLGGSDLDNILFHCLEGTIVLKEGIRDEQ